MVPDDSFADFLEERTVPFNEGDLFVAFTDGVIETTNVSGKEFSAARLADAVKASRRGDAAEVSRQLLESLRNFSGKDSYDDDLTLVTLKRL